MANEVLNSQFETEYNVKKFEGKTFTSHSLRLEMRGVVVGHFILHLAKHVSTSSALKCEAHLRVNHSITERETALKWGRPRPQLP